MGLENYRTVDDVTNEIADLSKDLEETQLQVEWLKMVVTELLLDGGYSANARNIINLLPLHKDFTQPISSQSEACKSLCS